MANNKFFNHSDGRDITLLNAAEDMLHDINIDADGAITIPLKRLLDLQTAVKRAKTVDVPETSCGATAF